MSDLSDLCDRCDACGEYVEPNRHHSCAADGARRDAGLHARDGDDLMLCRERKITIPHPPPPDWIGSTWAKTRWPDWVPVEVRQRIQEFWTESWGRGPRVWWDGSKHERTPAFGEHAELTGVGSEDWHVGRYVHAWNNMGYCVNPDGVAVFISTCYWPRESHTHAALYGICECGHRGGEHHMEYDFYGPGCGKKDCPCTLTRIDVARQIRSLDFAREP